MPQPCIPVLRPAKEIARSQRRRGLSAETAKAIGLSTTRTWILLRDAYEHIDARLRGV